MSAIEQSGPLLVLLLAGLLAAALWRVVRNPVRLWRIGQRGGHLVIAGDAVVAPIVTGERRAGSPAVILAPSPAPRWVRRAARAGSPHVAPDDTARLARALRRARMVLLLGSDDDTIATAAGIADAADALHDRGLPLPMIVRVDDTSRHPAVEAALVGRVADAPLHIRLVSLPALIARAVLRSDVLDRVHRGGSRERLLLVLGFTPIVERYLLDLLVGAHFRDGRPVRVIVADIAATAARTGFLARWPAAERLALPEFVDATVDDAAQLAALLDGITARHGVPAAVLIDRPDEPRSLAALAAVDAAMRERGLVPPAYAVHAAAEDVPAYAAPVLPFGGAAVAAVHELTLHERHEELARSVHEFYLEGRLDEGEPLGSRPGVAGWDRLPEAIRDNNRLLVDLYGLKLRDIGARIMPGRGTSLAFEPAELDDLAYAEHDRWLASRQLAGWRWAEARDEATRCHPDLVPHDRLGEARVERNRAQIRIVTRLLARAGRHAVRDLRILVDPAGADGIATAAEAVRADYPDRALVFVGDLEEPSVRTALALVHAAGDPVQLVLTRHPEALVAGLSTEDAARTRTLLAGADRVFVPAAGETPTELLATLGDHRLGTAAHHPRARHPAKQAA